VPGIAGPPIAHWLLRYGFEPVLVEGAPALRTGGYIVDLWGLDFEVADKMGLLPALGRDEYRIDQVRIVDAKAAGRAASMRGCFKMRCTGST
jgi:2-polyprenyl-6-methoxyphenol hydroxylase-like FAD-dependent oxidoreductase